MLQVWKNKRDKFKDLIEEYRFFADTIQQQMISYDY